MEIAFDKDSESPVSLARSCPELSVHEARSVDLDHYMDMDTEFCLGEQTRGAEALKIHMIWSKLGAYLPTQDLLTLRTTCKVWNCVLVPVIRSTHAPIFFKGPESLAKYTAVMAESELVPFSKYVVRDLFGTMDTCCGPIKKYLPGSDPTDLFMDFMTICGVHTKSLRLGTGRAYRRRQGEDISEIRRPLFQTLPKLTELTLNMSSIKTTNSSTESFVIPPSKLPCLRRLIITNFGCNHSLDLVTDLIQSAAGLRELALRDVRVTSTALRSLRYLVPNLSKLTTVEIHGPTTAELFILLELGRRAQNPLQLRTFTVGIYERSTLDDINGIGKVLYQFLATQSRTLNTLDLSITCNRNPERRASPIGLLCIPKMDQLNTLRIWHLTAAAAWEKQIHFGEASIACTFPKLKRLAFDTRDFNCETDITFLHEDVTDVKITVDCATEALIRAVAGAFPSVAVCEVTLVDLDIVSTDISIIWTAWTTLRVLRLKYLGGVECRETLQLDEFLSGIPSFQFDDLNQDLAALLTPLPLNNADDAEMDLHELRALGTRYKTKPGLAELRNLRELDLNIGNWSAAELLESLTDIGGYFGLAMASTALQHITLRMPCFEDVDEYRFGAGPTLPADIKMSPECLALIRRALGPAAIIQVMVKQYGARQGGTIDHGTSQFTNLGF